MQNTATNRIDSFDIMKGIGIIAVVAGHCGVGVSIVYQFHIPLFVFISGALHKAPPCANVKELYCRLFKIVRKYYIPFLLFQFMALALHNYFFDINWISAEGNNTYKFLFFDYIKQIIKIILGAGEALVGSIWFLFALVLILIFYEILLFVINYYKIKNHILLISILSVMLPIISIFIKAQTISIAVLLFIFFWGGCLFRRYSLSEKIDFKIVLLALLFFSIAINFNKTYLDFSIPYLNVLNAFAGIIVSYGIAIYFIKKTSFIKKIVMFVGCESFAIMALHFLVFKMLSHFLIKHYNYSHDILIPFPVPELAMSLVIIYILFGLFLPSICSVIYFKMKKLILLKAGIE